MAFARPAGADRRSSRLSGRTALVLGANQDRGVAAATTLASHGARVVVVDGDPERLEACFGDDARFRIRPFPVSCTEDLVDLATVFPETDVLIHCADDLPSPVSSCLEAIRPFLPAMAARRRGSIISISSPRPSCAGRGGGPSSSKGTPNGMLRGVAADMQPFGVRVNVVEATGVECSSAVTFLASDSSAHVSGSVLAMEGGWTALRSLDDSRVPTSSARSHGAGFAISTGRAAERPVPFPLSLPVGPRGMRNTTTEDFYERRRA